MDFPCPLWLVYVLVPWRVIEDCHSRSGSSMNVGLEASLEPCEDGRKLLLGTGKLGIQAYCIYSSLSYT